MIWTKSEKALSPFFFKIDHHVSVKYDFGPISRENELKHFSGPKSQPPLRPNHLIYGTDSIRTHQSVAEIELQREY